MADVEDHGMDQHECSDMPSMAVTFPGPFNHNDVVVNGWSVPFLEAHMQGEDRVLLVIDQRLDGEFSVKEAERVIPFVADAISVALGYGCHPREGMDSPPPIKPHARPRRLTQLAASVECGLDGA
jgi:hypothetical protein